MRTPIIAIIGRPNVGKSTFFNRILKEDDRRRAIVEDFPGVTRDRNYALVTKFEIPFIAVDTGGLKTAFDDVLDDQVVKQTKLAIEEADCLIVMFDGKDGVQPDDQEVVDLVRRSHKSAIFVVNKIDGVEHQDRVYDFYSLGIDEPISISAAHNRGIHKIVESALSSLPNYESLLAEIERNRLLEEEQEKRTLEIIDSKEDLVQRFEEDEEMEMFDGGKPEDIDFEEIEEEPSFAQVYDLDDESYEHENKILIRPRKFHGNIDEDVDYNAIDLEKELDEGDDTLESVKIAIMGRPNVGKSTLFNTLAGSQRAIVSDIAGTTRDTLDFSFEFKGEKIILVDTAGMRKKENIHQKLERYSVLRSISALQSCDVALMMIDGVEGPTEQDAKIAMLAHDSGKSIIFVVNKWDLVKISEKTIKDYEQLLRDKFKFANYAPIFFVSALTGKRVSSLIVESIKVAYERSKRISTSALNGMLKKVIKKVAAPAYRGVPLKLYYATQVNSSPPRFLFFFNHTKAIHFSYMRFIKNRIREEFGFNGTDIKIIARKRGY